MKQGAGARIAVESVEARFVSMVASAAGRVSSAR